MRIPAPERAVGRHVCRPSSVSPCKYRGVVAPASRAVLFDADGVLVDSHAAYRLVWERWSRLRGLDPAAVLQATHARRPIDTIAEVAPHLDADAEHRHLVAHVDEIPDAFPLFPETTSTLEELPPDRWAIVTSGNADRVRARLRAGGAPMPSTLVDGSSVRRSKPHPEGYLLAARQLAVQPGDCLVVEDAPAGIEAGLEAGMTVLAITRSHPGIALRRAHAIVPSLSASRPALRSWMTHGQLLQADGGFSAGF